MRTLPVYVLLFATLPTLEVRAQEAPAPPPAGIGWNNLFRGREPQVISNQAHPAICRVTVQEKDGIAFGSGSLIDIADDQGLVITNWHVVRDATGSIEVTFPDGFRSQAKVLKTDRDWDLAALVIWKPNVAPIPLAPAAAQLNEPLTIAGYGSGQFRAVTSRCTQYVSPGAKMPYEMVEVASEARQGDSGGPILNQRGEMAGVLFGAGGGTTSGSYVGRVRWFLASVSPRLGDPSATADVANIASSNPFVKPGGVVAQPVSIGQSTVADDAWRVAARTSAKPDANAAPDNEMTPVSLGSSIPETKELAAVPSIEVTFGALPPREPVGPSNFPKDPLVTSEPTLPLFPRPLPLPHEAPGELRTGGAATSVADSGEARKNDLWTWFFGQTPIEQGKSLLAVLGVAAVASRFWRSA